MGGPETKPPAYPIGFKLTRCQSAALQEHKSFPRATELSCFQPSRRFPLGGSRYVPSRTGRQDWRTNTKGLNGDRMAPSDQIMRLLKYDPWDFRELKSVSLGQISCLGRTNFASHENAVSGPVRRLCWRLSSKIEETLLDESKAEQLRRL